MFGLGHSNALLLGSLWHISECKSIQSKEVRDDACPMFVWIFTNRSHKAARRRAKLCCEVAASSHSVYLTQVFHRHYLQLGSCNRLTCQPWTWIRVVIDGYVRATGRDVRGDLPASFITWACWPCDEGRQGLPDGSGESDVWTPPSSSRVSRDGWPFRGCVYSSHLEAPAVLALCQTTGWLQDDTLLVCLSVSVSVMEWALSWKVVDCRLIFTILNPFICI